MSSTVAGNAWGEIVHHEADGILELRWLPAEMTDGAFKATLALLAWEAEKLRPSFLLIDATRFHHQFDPEVMRWRDDCVIPRYGAAGVTKFAFLMPDGFPNTIEKDGTVSNVLVTQGAEPFADQARRAVREWRFTPAQRENTPVVAHITARVEFRQQDVPSFPARAPRPAQGAA